MEVENEGTAVAANGGESAPAEQGSSDEDFTVKKNSSVSKSLSRRGRPRKINNHLEEVVTESKNEAEAVSNSL